MKLKLIGTGAIYSKYGSASTLVDETILVDVPNGILKQMLNLNVDVSKIDTILITHFHGDHIADIPFLILYLYGIIKKKEKITILGPKGIENKIIELANVFSYSNAIDLLNNNAVFVELTENTTYSLNNEYNIQTKRVEHLKKLTSYGYIINNLLGLTGDSSLCDGVEEIVEKSQLSVIDCSGIEGSKTHMGIDNLEYLVKKYNTDLIPTHLKDETREALKECNNKHILLHSDGDEIVLNK